MDALRREWMITVARQLGIDLSDLTDGDWDKIGEDPRAIRGVVEARSAKNAQVFLDEVSSVVVPMANMMVDTVCRQAHDTLKDCDGVRGHPHLVTVMMALLSSHMSSVLYALAESGLELGKASGALRSSLQAEDHRSFWESETSRQLAVLDQEVKRGGSVKGDVMVPCAKCGNPGAIKSARGLCASCKTADDVDRAIDEVADAIERMGGHRDA
jgi:hypothetical protein